MISPFKINLFIYLSSASIQNVYGGAVSLGGPLGCRLSNYGEVWLHF
jgi:hypothetical protein